LRAVAAFGIGMNMTNDAKEKQSAKDARLREALRANLKRRKGKQPTSALSHDGGVNCQKSDG
jgi:hypothetical protein